MKGIALPESAAGPPSKNDNEENERYLPGIEEEIITNPYPGKGLLTRMEALDAINRLSSMMLIDGYNRRRTPSTEEHKRCL
jgi:hypothetical protein